MEELLRFLSFSLGASLGVRLVRALSQGGRPVLRGAVKTGIVVGDAVRSATASATAGVRQNLRDLRDEAMAARRADEPRKIAIARD